MAIKTYLVDFSQKEKSNIAKSILADVFELDKEADNIKENSKNVKAETKKIMLDIVNEINPHLEVLGLKIHPSPHFYHTNHDNGHLICTTKLNDQTRGCWGGGIILKITNPNKRVTVNKKQINQSDFQPIITVERKMKENMRSSEYLFTNISEFLEKEKDNIKEMYLSNRK